MRRSRLPERMRSNLTPKVLCSHNLWQTGSTAICKCMNYFGLDKEMLA